MSNNLNNKLYKRFGLQLPREKVQRGFLDYVNNLINDKLQPLSKPDMYKDKEKLSNIQRSILTRACREMFLDINKYKDWDFGFGWFLKEFFNTNFPEVLVRLQILINLVHKEPFLKEELEQFAKELEDYFQDYPILGLTLKTYKTKSPQLLPSTSKEFGETVKDTLTIFESSEEYKSAMKDYEDGLKGFLSANTKAQFKDVIEDIYTSLDVLVQVITKNKKKGFRNIFVGKSPVNVGFNKWQLNIYGEARSWMDTIKHGAERNLDKDDVETLILLVSRATRTIILNTS